MNEAQKLVLESKMEEFLAFRRALTDESDRGCALFAGSYLEQEIKALLKAHLASSDEENWDAALERELFKNGPLSSLAACTSLAFYSGYISVDLRQELNQIRKIRNKFAHSSAPVAFDSPDVADWCRELKFSYWKRDDRPRGHFTAAAAGVLRQLHLLEVTAVPAQRRDSRAPTEEEKGTQRLALANAMPNR